MPIHPADIRHVSFVIGIDDYYSKTAPMILSVIKKCQDIIDRKKLKKRLYCLKDYKNKGTKSETEFKVNVFAIPRKLSYKEIDELIANKNIIPCIHGIGHERGECLSLDRFGVQDHFKLCNALGFSHVFKATNWEAGEGFYQALQRKPGWVIADHPRNFNKITKHGLCNQVYYHDYDIDGFLKLTYTEMFKKIPDITKVNVSLNSLDRLTEFVETVTGIEVLKPMFGSITRATIKERIAA